MTTIRDKVRQAPKAKKKRRAMFTCGSCHKRHNNPLGHRCTGGGGLKRKRAAAEQRAATAERRERERGIRTAERKRAQERVDETREAERGRASEKVAAARTAERTRIMKQFDPANSDLYQSQARGRKSMASARPAATSRGRRGGHDWSKCRDADCERQVCEAFREGVDVGDESGYQRGLLDCPRTHVAGS